MIRNSGFIAFSLTLAAGAASLALVLPQKQLALRAPATEKVELPEYIPAEQRKEFIRKAQVWIPGDIASKDILMGPAVKDGLVLFDELRCTYVPRSQHRVTGNSPKFFCLTEAGKEFKVKYGIGNGEVYGEVLATRLLWALGFGADNMFPVKVFCVDCPKDPHQSELNRGIRSFEPAATEIKMRGKTLESFEDEGLRFTELNEIDESQGGAPREQVDALKLLATFIQHGDNKQSNQRLICLEGAGLDEQGNFKCDKPLAMIQDVGITFGRSTPFGGGAISFKRWVNTPIWRGDKGCKTNLTTYLNGTGGGRQEISEAGRKFLSGLLHKLTDEQIANLFIASRIDWKEKASIDEWVWAFKDKLRQIDERACN